jgi:hypothetical protein
MKNLPTFSLGRRNYIFGILNALLAIGLTVLSFRYVQPADCFRLCGASDGTPCPPGACRFGEQKAGWPFPAFVDAPGGGSPTGGWGMLGPEDLPLPGTLILDVLFYSVLLWFALYIIQRGWGPAFPLRIALAMLPLNIFFAIALWVFYMFFGYSMPIGRGHGGQVYVDTPTSTYSATGFYPIVSIPLDELVETYGDPDDLRLLSSDTSKAPSTQLVLYWDAIGMFVELPEIEDTTYLVKKTTRIEMIIFFNEEKEGPVLAIARKPLGTQKIRWKGYGNYQP